ncbi:hypothetical protein KI387_034233, partial [Taxus chinensis]
LGTALPNLKYFSEAFVTTRHISEMIERVPDIDCDDNRGEVMEKVYGELDFKNVRFAYPSRPHTKVLHNFYLTILGGQTVALVGNSGSGKSTVISLLERFYDPVARDITVYGINIKNLQLRWWRNQIGLVSQEPALFATSIEENIRFGKEGASVEDVVYAAKASNAQNFISQLPHGYNTRVGEIATQMSGGQKQRIAIARAMIKNPPIFLLDEATSALDVESEKVVQQALDRASMGRTTVVVTHRLSTIQNANKIVVVQRGQVIESAYLCICVGQHDLCFFIRDHQEMKLKIKSYDLVFFSLCIISFMVNVAQHYSFAAMGELITKRIRESMLAKVLTFEVGWFDQEDISSKAICSMLANEANVEEYKVMNYLRFYVGYMEVKSLVTDRISLVIQTCTSVMLAVALRLSVAWRLARVMIAIQPLTTLCYYTRKVMLINMSKKSGDAQNQCIQIAAEAVANHITITTFRSNERVLSLFKETEIHTRKEGFKQSWVAGIGIGSAQSLTFLTLCLDYWYGGRLVGEGLISPGDVFKTFFILVSTGRVIA